MRNAIAEAQRQGRFRVEVRATFAAKALFGALDEMATNWILSRKRYALAGQADEVVDLFVRGMTQ
ncbi:MAG: TetR/AcrR family transcriptional regulator C-terminal domain-containing protein [Ilumatobacter sp.]|nr:TetR/AcrR family transcriptional regulator C-terminal domain-containing protein [Ilumatobacter sp.]